MSTHLRVLPGVVLLALAFFPAPGLTQERTIKGKTVSGWIKELESPSSNDREYAAHILGEVREHAKVVVPALSKALKDKNSEVARRSAESLCRVAPAKTAVSALIEALKDKDSALARDAAANKFADVFFHPAS